MPGTVVGDDEYNSERKHGVYVLEMERQTLYKIELSLERHGCDLRGIHLQGRLLPTLTLPCLPCKADSQMGSHGFRGLDCKVICKCFEGCWHPLTFQCCLRISCLLGLMALEEK